MMTEVQAEIAFNRLKNKVYSALHQGPNSDTLCELLRTWIKLEIANALEQEKKNIT